MARWNGQSTEIRLTQTFDQMADSYDRWYETDEGRAILMAEWSCLRRVGGSLSGRWLEVGVGTGRFASVLGVYDGVDPSLAMLGIAARRGIRTCAARAEDLPLRSASLDGVLLALTLCFVVDPRCALTECRRVLRTKGRLLLGVVPADSAWGREYARKASAGHSVYSAAHFRPAAETLGLVESSGFTLLRAASSLFWGPGESPQTDPMVEAGISPGAGFVCLLFERLVEG